jgi:vacuolar-type H+-ATPase subunit B/Vma2
MQTQRLIGQQSLGEFMGLHVNLKRVFEDNMKKTGVLRKNNFIINSKDNPNKEERKKLIEANK